MNSPGEYVLQVRGCPSIGSKDLRSGTRVFPVKKSAFVDDNFMINWHLYASVLRPDRHSRFFFINFHRGISSTLLGLFAASAVTQKTTDKIASKKAAMAIIEAIESFFLNRNSLEMYSVGGFIQKASNSAL